MSLRSFVAMGWVVAVGLGWGSLAQADQARLDPEALKAALRTTAIEENDYIRFLVVLVDQGRLPRVVVDTAFRWARQKSYRQYQFFKRAVINHAERLGIALPSDTPPARADIRGRVVQRVLLTDVPVPFIEVRIAGTSLKTHTNLAGEFTLANQPWGSYLLEAHGGPAQLFRTVTATVNLPYLPNDSTTVTLRFR